MHLYQVLVLALASVNNASPVANIASTSAVQGPPVVSADTFQPDWDAIEAEYKAAMAKTISDPNLAKRLNTASANNVGYGQAIYAAGSAAISQVKSLSNWNKVKVQLISTRSPPPATNTEAQAREQFTQLTTQIMMDHNPNSTEAVSAICYNQGYSVKDPQGIYGLRSEDLSIFPAKTE